MIQACDSTFLVQGVLSGGVSRPTGAPEAQHFLVSSDDGVRVPTEAQSAQHGTVAGLPGVQA